MKYLVLHREQVTLNLEKEIFDDYKKARHRQYELNANYHDTILLSEQDLLELKLHMNHNVSKTV
jgi:hypothetical protein